jgi:hypothetical protein
MIDYQTYCQIRHLRDQEQLSVGQIARQLELVRTTVRKWIARPRYERKRPAKIERPSKLDAFKPAILRWLHIHPYTAAQLLPKIREQGYTGGYNTSRSSLPKPATSFSEPPCGLTCPLPRDHAGHRPAPNSQTRPSPRFGPHSHVVNDDLDPFYGRSRLLADRHSSSYLTARSILTLPPNARSTD